MDEFHSIDPLNADFEPYCPNNPMFAAIKKVGVLALLCSSIFGSSPLHAQRVTVNPPELTTGFKNPLKGTEGDVAVWQYNPQHLETISFDYIRWNQIEPNADVTVQQMREFFNNRWKDMPRWNVKVVPRIVILYNDAGYWPSDLTTGDWSSPEFKSRVVRLIGRLGEIWDNDPRVAWVHTGIMGNWGEQEGPVGVSVDGWADRLGNAYKAAFKNKKLSARNLDQWPNHELGNYWDLYPNVWAQGYVAATIKDFNRRGLHLVNPHDGEIDYGHSRSTTAPIFGNNLAETLSNDQFTNFLIDNIRELHTTGMRFMSGYDPNAANGATVRANAARMQNAFGYHFQLSEFSSSARTEPGGNLQVQFKVKNTGSAPMYENWPVAVVLIDETTREIVWKSTLPNVDIRSWHPGSEYNRTTRLYSNPAKEHLISASLPIPASLNEGQYLVGLSILEPTTRQPGVFFAIPNFFKESQSQPLCRIGVGTTVSDPNLTGVSFDDMYQNDKRFYTLVQQGATHTLAVQPSAHGAITRDSGSTTYFEDTGVMVTAKGIPGYAFSSWGGALSGSTQNPAIIVMDADKSISANYVPVSTFTLTTTANNGSVVLNPPGGVYNVGTVVKVTGVSNSGYSFSSWTGDLVGSTNSLEVTMNSNKNVTANFVVDPSGGVSEYRIDCGGDRAYSSSSGLSYIAENTLGNNYYSWVDIANTSDTHLYRSERYGSSFSYEPLLTNGTYDVTLMFAENYHGSVGSRKFNVTIEGVQKLMAFDTYAEALKDPASSSRQEPKGKHFAVERTIPGVVVEDGKLTIKFDSVVGDASVMGIRVGLSSNAATRSVRTNASNGFITMNPPGGSYLSGKVVTFTARPNSGYSFMSWSGDLTGTENPKSVIIDGDKSVSANFGYKLDCTALDGTITLNSPGPVYPEGTVVTATATPNSGFAFGSWNGDVIGQGNPATITMTSSKKVVASIYPVSHVQTQVQINSAGGSYTAEDGAIFEADSYAIGGDNGVSAEPIANTNDDALYQSVRWGPVFSYDIPLPNGHYEVALMFAETYYNSAGSRIFNATVEGNQVIRNLDIWSEVGMNTAYNRVHTASVTDGHLNINFSRVVDNVVVSAIKVRSIPPKCYTLRVSASNGLITLDPPGGIYPQGTVVTLKTVPGLGYSFGSWSGDISGLENPKSITITSNHNVTANFNPVTSYLVNCGGHAYTAANGDHYLYDSNYGTWDAHWIPGMSGTADNDLYSNAQRGGWFEYGSGLANGDYEVTLKFADLWWKAPGENIFNVDIEQQRKLTNFDIRAHANSFTAYDKIHRTTVDDNMLNISFSRVTGEASIAAIKVTSLPTPAVTLQTSAPNGAITLDPPGGSYLKGTVVKVTAVPNTGDSFGSWNGNLTGNVNPRWITMNEGKSVTANFTGHAVDLAYGFTPGTTADFSITATDQARDQDGDGQFNNTGEVGVYWRGSSSDVTYMHFDLSSLAGATINSDVNLKVTVANTYGRNTMTNGQLSTTNNTWTYSSGGATPARTAVAGSPPVSGNFPGGSRATWVIPEATLQGFVDTPSTFTGFALSAGSNSGQHWTTLPTLTGNATTFDSYGITVTDPIDWSAAAFAGVTLSVSGLSNVSGGNVLIKSGYTLSIVDSAALDLGIFAGSFTNSGTLSFAGSGAQTLSGAITNTGTLSFAGSGARILSGVIANTGTITNSGTLSFDSSAAQTISGAITNTGTLSFDGSGNKTLSGAISGNGSITKAGSGTLTLTNANANTGTVTVSGGTLAVTGAGKFYSTNGWQPRLVTIQSGGILEVDRWLGGGALGELPYHQGNIIMNNGTIRYTGSTSGTGADANGIGFTIGAGGATLESATARQTWNIALHYNGEFGIASNANGTLNLTGAGNGMMSKVIPGGGGLVKDGSGTWTLSAVNTYTGTTTVTGGTLALGVSNALPGTAVSIGNATLDAATFTDTVGTLDVTAAATINLGSGAALVFADSKAIDWADGTLNITGSFVSGSSIKFASSGGLDSTQLAAIRVNGIGTYTLDASGYLIEVSGDPFMAWATGGETFEGDANSDGVQDGLAWILGADTRGTNASDKLPKPANFDGFLTLDFQRLNPCAPAKLFVEFGNDLSGWAVVEIPAASGTIGDVKVEVTGVTQDTVKVKIPTTHQSVSGALFARLRATSN